MGIVEHKWPSGYSSGVRGLLRFLARVLPFLSAWLPRQGRLNGSIHLEESQSLETSLSVQKRKS